MSMTSEERTQLESRVASEYKNEKLWVKLWSLIHHSFLFGGAVFSALAALVLQLTWSIPSVNSVDLGTILAAAGALAGTIAGVGRFERKWRTNRLTRNRLNQLQITLTDPTCDGETVRHELKSIWTDHDKGILGPA